MGQYICKKCKKTFNSETALIQHSQTKHTTKQRVKPLAYILVVLLVAILAYYFLANEPIYDVKIKLADHTKGTGEVAIVEFSDFQCSACRVANLELKKFLELYGDKVKIAYRHYPFHLYAQKAAEASECADEQGKFWEYHDKLFENQNALTLEDLKKYANELNLNTTKFNTCLDNNVMYSKVISNKVEGDSLGVSATPTFFILGKKYEGSIKFDRLKEITGVDINPK